jgi:hypothetical protein
MRLCLYKFSQVLYFNSKMSITDVTVWETGRRRQEGGDGDTLTRRTCCLDQPSSSQLNNENRSGIVQREREVQRSASGLTFLDRTITADSLCMGIYHYTHTQHDKHATNTTLNHIVLCWTNSLLLLWWENVHFLYLDKNQNICIRSIKLWKFDNV